MSKTELQEVKEAVDACNKTLRHLNVAKDYINKSKNWGKVDIFGGGLISSVAKHSNLDKFDHEMKMAMAAAEELSKEIKDLNNFETIDISGTTKTFDIFFDNIFSDFHVQNQIEKKKKACYDAIYKIGKLKYELENKRRELEKVEE